MMGAKVSFAICAVLLCIEGGLKGVGDTGVTLACRLPERLAWTRSDVHVAATVDRSVRCCGMWLLPY